MSDEKKTTASSSPATSSAPASAASTETPKKIRITRPCASAGGEKIPAFRFSAPHLNRVFGVGSGEDQIDPKVAAVLLEKKAAVAAS